MRQQSTNARSNVNELTQSNKKLSAQFSLLLSVSMVILFVCFTGVLGVNLLESWWSNDTAGADEPHIMLPVAQATEAPPTVTPLPTSTIQQVENTSVSVATNEGLNQAIIPPPTAIRFDELRLPIHAKAITSKDLLDGQTSMEIRWVQNTVINYVLQFPPTAEGWQVLQALVEGSQIHLTTGVGEMRYTVKRIDSARPTAQTFIQKEPAVTLVWLGADPVIIYAQHTTPEENQATQPENVTPTEAVQVLLESGRVSDDGESLVLSGQINNVGTEIITIETTNLSLATEYGNYAVQEQLSGLPWVIAPGASQPLTVYFQRPNEAEAVLTVVNQKFTLADLR